MRPIPLRMRATLENMPRMKTCELAYEESPITCEGGIQWHHVWCYGPKGQINAVWAILGACEAHHRAVKTNKLVKEAFERRSLEYATDYDLAKYPNKPWQQLKKYLHVSTYQEKNNS